MSAGIFFLSLIWRVTNLNCGEFPSGLFNMETIRFRDEACGNPMATT
ncbi:hypothetical protein BFJ63_vAg1272 [Fusarium oxysporum f. sp. narcissi]|uniref:Uncharacterized protein n=1 Tax=Fusarium oxysporum f. sp. narcissi TaxID=451672 RepID=A0A4Q2W909_FUSOX|nr:hypothetical protein BFJ70_g9110 [Fusarium oxysporum]RYC95925.1 hypothetical protein BFJ63_vAg1272 [Fusarium oxysporum f. sp. narcissi]